MKPTDPRLECWACLKLTGEHKPAEFVALQHDEGDDDAPAIGRPVCMTHMRGWYNEVPLDDRLPHFKLSDGSRKKERS